MIRVYREETNRTLYSGAAGLITDLKVMELIQDKSEPHYDYISDFRTTPFRFEIENNLVYLKIQDLSFHKKIPNHSLGQMLSRVKAPVAFFQRCWNTTKLSILEQFCQNRNWLFRCEQIKDDSDSIRGILTPTYSTDMDDYQLFEAVFRQLHSKEYRVHLFEHDTFITRCVVRFPASSTEFEGNTFTAGMVVTTSEIGYSSIWIEPCVIIGNNRVLVNRADSLTNTTRIIHRGVISPERVHHKIEHAYEVSQIGVIQMMESAETTVTPEEVEKFVVDTPSFPSRFAQIVLEDIRNKESANKLEILIKIMDEAQKLPLVQAIALEQAAGKFSNVFKNHSSRAARIARDLQRTAQAG